MILPVILSGGAGERLWPLSRNSRPKQFLSVLGASQSMLQSTLSRIPVNNKNYLAPIIVCHEKHRFLVLEQTNNSKLKPQAIILESQANNTAAAIALAANWALKNYDDLILWVIPADHYIADQQELIDGVERGVALAQRSLLVTFGIKPDKPAIGYGYIKIGARIEQTAGYYVAQFIEKPELELAKKLIEQDNYLWNSGQFLFRASIYLNELTNYQPEINKVVKQAFIQSQQDGNFIRPDPNIYSQCSGQSIDYAVMEKTDKAAVVALSSEVGWNDLGCYQSLWEMSPKDIYGNFTAGKVVTQKTKNCFIDSRSRLIAATDIEDLVVIENEDAVLIARLDQGTNIKKLVNIMKEQQMEAAIFHKRVMRSWGWYDSIARGDRFQVKHILVQPGMSLSLQLHHHRSEHWVVVKGTAQVKRDNEEFILNENESTFIPRGVKHQLKNIGKIPLEVIEVQSGSYLGEDDIIRFLDD